LAQKNETSHFHFYLMHKMPGKQMSGEQMPEKTNARTNARERLDGAIAQERQAQREARQIYEELTEKMWAYQTGKGPAPTNEDFEQWSQAVEQRVKVKQLGIRVDGEPAA
jgi:thymidylate kinase